MKQTTKKLLALLLVLVQVFVLLPFGMTTAKADGEQSTDPVEPKLNHIYAGTVQFGAFHNSMPNEGTHKDGADYVVPYVYTDDYFALPSYSDTLASKTLLQKDINYTSYRKETTSALIPTQHTGKLYTRSLLWTEIESTSLATASMDFVMAAFGSNEQIDNSYANYSKNGKEFLQNIGFASSDITVNDEFDKIPGLDTIGVVIGSKPIEVYNPSTKTNDGYTLVAIGIRGGGYGAEWGSNFKLGSGVDSLEHQGFREATDKVLGAVNQHIANHSTQFAEGTKVKYWIVGYSRSGAVANLVAGDMTDAAASFKTTAKDIYAYTFEAAAGAAATREPSDTATNYPNIHNILNQLDPVPYVSTAGMGNIRLGINYLTPYYGNTKNTTQNTGYYENMHDILETVAQGYNGDDAIVAQAQPGNLANGNYPMDGKLLLQKFDIQKAIFDSDTYPMGLLPYNEEGWKGTHISNSTGNDSNGYYISMEYFLYQLVDEFFGSRAWDYDASKITGRFDPAKWTWDYEKNNDTVQITNTDQMTHRLNYATKGNYNKDLDGTDFSNSQEVMGQTMTYQEAIRYLINQTMARPGSKLVDVFNGLSTDLFMNWGGVTKANGLYGSIVGELGGGYDDKQNENRASIVDSHFRDILYTVLETGDIFKDTSYTYKYRACGQSRVVIGGHRYDEFDISQQTADAIGTLSPVLSRMFLYDRNAYGSQYLGTLLKYGLNTIIVNHVPEVVVSWQMAMDDFYTSDYRKITLPNNTNVAMYLFRDGIDEPMLDSNVPEAIAAKGVKVAEVNAGTFDRATCADDRINVTDNGNGTFTIFYPGSVDYRFDVTTVSQTDAIQDVSLTLADFQPTNGVNVKATYDRASKGNVIASTRALDYDSMLEQNDSTSADSINTYAGSHDLTLQPDQTLHVMAWSGSNAPGAEQDTQYAIELTTDKTKLADFGTITVSEDAATGHVYKAESGTFATTDKTGGTNVTYTLNQKTEEDVANAKSIAAFDTVDVADAAKTNHDNTLYLTDHVSVVPASSVYFDDNLAGQTFTSDGHGYSSDINDQAVSKSATAAQGTFYYTFYGTGIDAYCTTDSESSYVSAAVFHTDDPTACSKDNRVDKAVTVSNKSSEGTRYNTPTISFTNLKYGADVYTLKIVANDNAKFKLDGVRVYNPVMATDDEGNTTAAAAKQAEIGEGNTLYLNLHDLLLNADQGFSVNPVTGMSDDFDKSTISGVLFVDNAANLATESHYYIGEGETAESWHEQAVTLYQTQFDAYKNNSPKNEIYLAAKDGTKTQAVTFQVNTQKAPVGSTIYIGMSAPETGKGKVSVTGNGTKDVTSVMDMYYGITVPSDGLITITNVGDSLIALTNLKITNVPEAKGILGMGAPERKLAMRAFFQPVTTETVELAAAPEEVVIPEDPVIPEETPAPEVTPAPTPDPTPAPTPVPTPTPTPNSTSAASAIFQMFSDFVFGLFRGFGRLFGH